MFNVIIIGGGMAAFSAAIYAARRGLSILVLAKDIGGQANSTDLIENYPGVSETGGYNLVNSVRAQAINFGAQVEMAEVEKIKSAAGSFIVYAYGKQYKGSAVILAFGKTPRDLDVPGEQEFKGKGVSYCATCDAPLFGEKTVAVVGGGNSGLDSAMQLTKYAKKVYVLVRSDIAKGDQITQDKLKEIEAVEFIMNAEVQEIKGDKFVNKMIYKDKASGEEKELDVEGVFVNVGMIPNSDFLKGFCELNQWGEVVINPKTNATSHVGVFAAGDVTDILEKQTVIAAGEGAKAALQCYKWLASN